MRHFYPQLYCRTFEAGRLAPSNDKHTHRASRQNERKKGKGTRLEKINALLQVEDDDAHLVVTLMEGAPRRTTKRQH
jgi:hypothetical protein